MTEAELLTEDTFRAAAMVLAEQDPAIAAVVEAYGVPPFWHRPATFATLVLLIVEQQVSLASAKAVFDRMVAGLGPLSAPVLVAAEDSALVAAGLTRQKQRYLRLLAAAVVEGRFDLDELAACDDAEARRQLLSLVGVGPWTADVYLLSALRRPDLWPVGDRALQVGAAEVLGLGEVPDPVELERLGDRWRPLRSVAARLVWHNYLQRRGRNETEVAGLA